MTWSRQSKVDRGRKYVVTIDDIPIAACRKTYDTKLDG